VDAVVVESSAAAVLDAVIVEVEAVLDDVVIEVGAAAVLDAVIVEVGAVLFVVVFEVGDAAVLDVVVVEAGCVAVYDAAVACCFPVSSSSLLASPFLHA